MAPAGTVGAKVVPVEVAGRGLAARAVPTVARVEMAAAVAVTAKAAAEETVAEVVGRG